VSELISRYFVFRRLALLFASSHRVRNSAGFSNPFSRYFFSQRFRISCRFFLSMWLRYNHRHPGTKCNQSFPLLDCIDSPSFPILQNSLPPVVPPTENPSTSLCSGQRIITFFPFISRSASTHASAFHGYLGEGLELFKGDFPLLYSSRCLSIFQFRFEPIVCRRVCPSFPSWDTSPRGV